MPNPEIKIKIPREFIDQMNSFMMRVQSFQGMAQKVQQSYSSQSSQMPKAVRPANQILVSMKRASQSLKKMTQNIEGIVFKITRILGGSSKSFMRLLGTVSEGFLGRLSFMLGPFGKIFAGAIGLGVSTVITIANLGILGFQVGRWLFDRMVELGDSVVKDWLEATGVGTTIGGLRAFRTTFLDLPNTTEILSRVGKARFNAPSRAFIALKLLGVKRTNDTAEMAVQAIIAARQFMLERTQDPGTALREAEYSDLTELFSAEFLLSLTKMTIEEAIKHKEQFKLSRTEMNVSKEAVKAWQDFTVKIHEMGANIQSVIAEKFADPKTGLPQALAKLSEALVPFFQDVLNSKAADIIMDKIIKYIKVFVDWVESGEPIRLVQELEVELKKVVTTLEQIGKEGREMLRKLGISAREEAIKLPEIRIDSTERIRWHRHPGMDAGGILGPRGQVTDKIRTREPATGPLPSEYPVGPPGTKYDPISGTSLGGGVGSDSASMGRGRHQGVDVMAPYGSPVYSTMDGVIERFGTDNFGKATVTIRHPDGTRTVYMHMSGRYGKVGDSVKGGQVIGKSGSANGVPHLHVERWRGPPRRPGSVLLDPSREMGWDKRNLPRGGQPSRTNQRQPGQAPVPQAAPSPPAAAAPEEKPVTVPALAPTPPPKPQPVPTPTPAPSDRPHPSQQRTQAPPVPRPAPSDRPHPSQQRTAPRPAPAPAPSNQPHPSQPRVPTPTARPPASTAPRQAPTPAPRPTAPAPAPTPAPATAASRAVGGNSALAQDRARFAEEMRKNPQVRDMIAAMGEAEVQGQPGAQTGHVEALMNRASARGHTLAQELNSRYYAPYRTGEYQRKLRNLTDAQRRKWNPHINEAVGGSDTTNLSTGTASGGEKQFGRSGYFGQGPGRGLIKELDGELFGEEAGTGKWRAGMREKVKKGTTIISQQTTRNRQGETIRTQPKPISPPLDWRSARDMPSLRDPAARGPSPNILSRPQLDILGTRPITKDTRPLDVDLPQSLDPNKPSVPSATSASSASRVIEAQAKEAEVRKLPISDKLRTALDYASAKTGLTVRVTSGGQYPKGTGHPHKGSPRHDRGDAADFDLYDANGNKVPHTDPRALKFVEEAARAGVKGGGAERSYMGDYKIHLDVVGAERGGAPGVYRGSKALHDALNRGRKSQITPEERDKIVQQQNRPAQDTAKDELDLTAQPKAQPEDKDIQPGDAAKHLIQQLRDKELRDILKDDVERDNNNRMPDPQANVVAVDRPRPRATTTSGDQSTDDIMYDFWKSQGKTEEAAMRKASVTGLPTLYWTAGTKTDPKGLMEGPDPSVPVESRTQLRARGFKKFGQWEKGGSMGWQERARINKEGEELAKQPGAGLSSDLGIESIPKPGDPGFNRDPKAGGSDPVKLTDTEKSNFVPAGPNDNEGAGAFLIQHQKALEAQRAAGGRSLEGMTQEAKNQGKGTATDAPKQKLTPADSAYPNQPMEKHVVKDYPPEGVQETEASQYGNWSEPEGSTIPGGWRDVDDIDKKTGKPNPTFTGSSRSEPGISVPFLASSGGPGKKGGGLFRVQNPITKEWELVRQKDIGPNMENPKTMKRSLDINAPLAERWGFVRTKAQSKLTGKPVWTNRKIKWEYIPKDKERAAVLWHKRREEINDKKRFADDYPQEGKQIGHRLEKEEEQPPGNLEKERAASKKLWTRHKVENHGDGDAVLDDKPPSNHETDASPSKPPVSDATGGGMIDSPA